MAQRSPRPRSGGSSAPAVARLAGKYGREWFTEKARSGGKTTELWLEIGRNGYLGINIPEEYGGGGGGIGDIAAVCEELAAQGCPLLLMVVSPAICGTIISRYGTEEQKQRWLPGDLRRHRHHGVRDHRARRRHQHPQHHHDRPPRRRRVGAQRPQDLHLRRRRGRPRARRRPGRGRADRQGEAGAVRRPDRRTPASRRSRSRWRSSARSCSSRCSSTTYAWPPTRSSATRTAVSCSCSPGSTRSGSWRRRSPPGWRATRSTGRCTYAKEREVFQGPIGSHQAVAHPLAQSHIEIEMARLMTQKAAALYDAGDDMARGRGRQHGQVRRRRGRLRRRRPRRADPRRQRHHPGVRHGRPAGRHPRRPDRPASAAR